VSDQGLGDVEIQKDKNNLITENFSSGTSANRLVSTGFKPDEHWYLQRIFL
tara:strand:- start:160 stop:312 length:153 start_codon:yes stop_codon:yes gene_type:complete